VACTAATACTAVGEYYSDSVPNAMTMALRWDGTSWTRSRRRAAGREPGSRLLSVACTAPPHASPSATAA